jgi:hypothetical protein
MTLWGIIRVEYNVTLTTVQVFCICQFKKNRSAVNSTSSIYSLQKSMQLRREALYNMLTNLVHPEN